MVTINSILLDILKLDEHSRDKLLEILQKRQIKARRDEIAKNAKTAIKDHKVGKLVPTDAGELIKKLNSL